MTVRLLALALLCACAAGQVRANPVIDSPGIRWPGQNRPPTGPRQVSLTIEAGPDQQTRLRIPSRMLKDWLAVAARTDGSVQTAGLGAASWLTVMAGLALTAGMVLGGLWLRRPRLRRQLLGGFACLLAGGLVLGVTGCPWGPQEIRTTDKPIEVPTFKPDSTLTGQVLLEKDDSADTLLLLINRDALAKLAANPPGPGQPLSQGVEP